jgi:hypothetical protein
MPDRRQHRGPNPEDHKLFRPDALPALRAATHDLSWLLGHDYAIKSALKLVGDRYQLTERQRAAVLRSSCSEARASARRARQLGSSQLQGEVLSVDGFNVLTTLEVALSGGVLLIGRDGAMRDIAGVHGSYRKVSETTAAIELLGQLTRRCGVRACEIYLDQPVSNSGRLRAHILDVASAHSLPFDVHVVPNPDRVLMQSAHVVASADAQILDADVRWTNLARDCVAAFIVDANIVDLSA